MKVHKIKNEPLRSYLLFSYAKKIEDHQDFDKIGDEFFKDLYGIISYWYFTLKGVKTCFNDYEDAPEFTEKDGKLYLTKLTGFNWKQVILNVDDDDEDNLASWLKNEKRKEFSKCMHIYELFTTRMEGEFYIESSDIEDDSIRREAAHIFNLMPDDDLRGLVSIQDTGLFDYKINK